MFGHMRYQSALFLENKALTNGSPDFNLGFVVPFDDLRRKILETGGRLEGPPHTFQIRLQCPALKRIKSSPQTSSKTLYFTDADLHASLTAIVPCQCSREGMI